MEYIFHFHSIRKTSLLCAIFVGVFFTPSCSSSKGPVKSLPVENFDEASYYNPKKVELSKDSSIDFKSAEIKGGFESIFKYLEYPASAKRNKITGLVISEVFVNENRKIDNIKIISSPDSSLSKAATKAIIPIEFVPATLNGDPVKSITYVPLQWNMK